MLSEIEIERVKKMNPVSAKLNLQGLIPVHIQKVTMSTGGGTQTVTISGVKSTDVCQVSLVSDDTGTSIVHLEAACGDGTVVIKRTDDGSSADNGVVLIVVYRLV